MKNFIIAIIVLIVIVGGVLALTHKSSNKASTTTSTTSKTSTNTSATTKNNSTSNSTTSTDQNSAATIIYTDNGFSPSTLTVKSGTLVTIKNTSSQDMQFDSDPHPVHTDDPQLNVGLVAAGQSVTFTPTTTGSHGYHNHLDPSQTGTLVVD